MASMLAQVCHERNIHGRSLEEVRSAALAMEAIPSIYPQLDASGLLQETQPTRKQVKSKQSCDAAAVMQAFELGCALTSWAHALGRMVQDGLCKNAIIIAALSDVRTSLSYHSGGHQRGGHGRQ